MENKDRTIALLIDSDNISQDYFAILMEELNKFGSITYSRIYGDFTSQNANGWRPLLLEHAIEPMQQYPSVSGKNATDSAMIIDAMDIMYTGKVDCFCLATSDSDFTKLATRFRNANITVIGAGEAKTPIAFRAACHHFLLMDTLLANTKAKETAQKTSAKAGQKKPSTETTETKKAGGYILKPSGVLSLEKLVSEVKEIIKQWDSNGDGWANYGNVYGELCKKHNTFQPKNYGVNMTPINFFKNLPQKPFTIEVGPGVQRIRTN